MTFTNAFLARLEGAGEAEFTQWVKRRAKHYGWEGFHVRDSEGNLESLHTERHDGYTEAIGIPDWYFWHEALHEAFWAELKGASGHLSTGQKREIPSMQLAGITVFTWWPKDARAVEEILAYGVKAWT